MAEVTVGVTSDAMRENTKRVQQCKVVDVALTNIADADTYAVGPGLLTAAFIETAAGQSGEGEVGMIYSPTTQLITFDTSVTANGTLRLFYGKG